MENYAELGKDRLLNIKCRVNQPSVPRVLRFVNSDGSAHPITDYAFRIPVWKSAQASTAVFTLTIGDGLTVQGDDLNELLIEVSEERATIRPSVYFWLLEGLFESEYQAWLNGDWEFYIGKYNGVEAAEEITISTAEAVVLITVEGSGTTLSLEILGETLEEADSDTPLNPDNFYFFDFVDQVLKLVSWTNIKATLKTYFDTLYQALTNTPTVITDGTAISLTTAEHTLSTAQATITVTDNYTGDYCGLRLTLNGITQVVLTFATGTALCAFGGTASGDNTMTVTGVAGDRVEISRKKLGTNYTYVGLNVGQ